MGQRVKITKVVKRRVLKTSVAEGTKSCPTCHGSGRVKK